MKNRRNHETDQTCARWIIAIAAIAVRGPKTRTWNFRLRVRPTVLLLFAALGASFSISASVAQDQTTSPTSRPTNPLRGGRAMRTVEGRTVEGRAEAVRQVGFEQSISRQIAKQDGDDDPEEPGVPRPNVAFDADNQEPIWEETETLPPSVLSRNDSRVLMDGPESIEGMLPAPTPRTVTINPLAIPQGVASLAFEDHQPLTGKRLGFPFSVVPDNVYHHIPRIHLGWDNPAGRSIGRGEPLQTTSWRNRPLHVDFFSGGYFAAAPIDGVGDPSGAYFLGGIIGWDLNHYFGTELRIGYARANLDEIQNSMDIRVSDVHLHYYPWGDARVRPYTKIGLGLTHFELNDSMGLGRSATSANLPLGIGVKYFVKHWLTLRAEFEDNITFGSGSFSTTNNLSITGGVEFRFGGRRPTYYPFTSSRMSFF